MALQQQQQQSSRLNRLLTLLDTGSTSATRSTAARQIGEIARQHPGELQPLLRRVRQFLRSKAWETRVAAAKAVGAIAENVHHVSVKDVLDKAIVELQSMGCAVSLETLLSGYTSGQSSSALAFSNFDINRVLEYGGLLLSSGGQEYDVVMDSSKSPAERLARQKQNFRRRLGLDDFVDVNEMIRDDDLMAPRHVPGRQQGRREEAQRLVANMVPGVLSRSLSAREKNKLKRKAKVIVKDGPKQDVDVEEPGSKRAKPVITESSQGDKLVLDSVLEDDGVDASDGRWPFDRFVDLLMHDMFDPVWEIRHGSIMALREILSSHAACAAVADPEAGMVVAAVVAEEKSNVSDDKRAESTGVEGLDQKPGISKDVAMHDSAETKEDKPSADNGAVGPSAGNGALNATDSIQETEEDSQKELDLNQDVFQPAKGSLPAISVNEKAAKVIAGARHAWAANTEFLQDCTLRLICVFALDRFGDFVSDQVVAPVRETCAQVLGAVFKQMSPPLLHETLGILLQMQQCTEWEVRHGSLLGIKYLVAVRREMISEILPRILPACVAGLGDPDDDVRAIAAEALLPASSALVSQAGHALKTILLLLWDILLDLDDLSPSTSSVMHLLAELYSRPEALSTTLRTSGGPAIDLNDEASASEAEDQLDLGDPHSLSLLAPRLWPFMRHNISSVRLAAIRTLEQLLEAGNSGDTSWTIPILGDALRLVYQNLLMEPEEVILQSSLRVWRVLVERACSELEMSTIGYFSSWLELASTAAGASLEASSMFSPTSLPKGSRSKAVAKLRAAKAAAFLQITEPQRNLDVIPKVVVGGEGERSIIHMRASSACALGILAARAPDSMLGVILQALSNALSSPSGVQRQVAAMVLVTCFKELSLLPQEQKLRVFVAAKPLDSQLQTLLSATDPSQPTPGSAHPYAELFRTYSKMRAEASQLLRQAEALGIDTGLESVDGLSVEGAISLAIKLKREDNSSTEEASSLETIRQPLLATAGYLKCVQANLHGSILALMASAIVWMGQLPAKLNPIIQPLMISMKREQEELLQQSAAEALAEVIAHCVGRKPCPNDKLIKNLSSMACADTMETPVATDANSACNIEDMELVTSKAASSVKKSDTLPAEERAKLLEGSVTRRGAELAIKALCQKFGEQLFEKLPKLWDCLTDVIKPSESQSSSIVLPQADPQALINNFQLVRTISPFLGDQLQSRVLDLLPAIFGGVRHPHAAVRLAASRCIAAMARTTRETVMTAVLSKAMPMLTDASSVEARQGAGMLITFLVDGLGVDLVPYAPLLIVPLLGCMGDSNQVVRQSVTHSFAALVPLLPLARGLPPPPGLPSSKSSEDAKFLEQLLDNSRVEDYKLAFNLSTPLRRYQQEGINWLAFLKRFKLHGILCDDMGLGKTLQASAIVASDTAERSKKGPVQSLIVCPPTLVGHWIYEIEKFIPSDVLKPMQYVGQPHERVYLRNQFPAHNVIITSYDVLRKDVDYLSQILWNFYILDEGHIIKNGKSKVTLAVKRVQAEHRLILSGTPVQNNVLELWSLFDFLMPGFLGTERQFHASYGKPLLAARDSKCSAKEAEAGIFAMEALHKQVMPFLLRRTKDEVLADLPPKIIQDRYCDLSPLQLQLYERFSDSQTKKDVSKLVEDYGSEDSAKPTAPKHVFQALQYLRKVCSHPVLVLQSGEIAVEKSDLTADLHDIQHSPKLLALRDILEECGIGQTNGSEASAFTGQHRVLIFGQFKAFLDIIEKDLFQTHMKSVTYLRLDGSIDVDKRFEIVKAFNSDPTIDVLLLTTQVGGLGLNLTSADTVVFMEHDWNPMRDLQAMDRAHRLGQRRVVNVHRLIMRGTMEEKIMSLQQFKLSVANTVINADNASLNAMDTGQLLDLFTVSDKKASVASSSKSTENEDGAAEKPKVGGRKGLKSMLSSLEELWDQSLYSEEYNIGQFIDRLK